ncbi:MAG: ATP-binding cassette domain-containing protein [Treponema sp.]|jgi:oligopeptide transport system ATP-binding protein|nr:ATP-binding cassette domain-containing protein [Treponema sp.]
MDNMLEVKNLKMHFPNGTTGIIGGKKKYIYAVDGVSFSIRKGETLGLVGESGCGKSTVARAVAQLYKPTAGEVLLDGKDITKMSKKELLKYRKDMQVVFQDPYSSLDPRMTTGAIISEPLRIYRRRGIISMTDREIDSRVEHLMELVGLSRFFKNRYPHEFSGGQRQRIGIARALALRPRIILADEPVSALDVSIQSQILNLFKDIQKAEGLSYLFIAHDLAVIRYISDRIAVMYLGKIVEIADYATLYSNPMHPYTKALLSAAPIPDPEIELKRKRIILSGDVPAPDRQRPGCYFYDRCPNRMDCCKEKQPVLKHCGADGEDHTVACFLYK